MLINEHRVATWRGWESSILRSLAGKGSSLTRSLQASALLAEERAIGREQL